MMRAKVNYKIHEERGGEHGKELHEKEQACSKIDSKVKGQGKQKTE